MSNTRLRIFFLFCVSFLTLAGCQRDSREYLRALESKLRLIEGANKARNDMIDGLDQKSLARADLAMEAELKIEQDAIILEQLLDTLRPHRPDAAKYSNAKKMVEEFERERLELREQWVVSRRGNASEKAKELSAKIRDVEMNLAEAMEAVKISSPVRDRSAGGGVKGQ